MTVKPGLEEGELEEVALRALEERHPERVLATNFEDYAAIVLGIGEIPPPFTPTTFGSSRVAVRTPFFNANVRVLRRAPGQIPRIRYCCAMARRYCTRCGTPAL